MLEGLGNLGALMKQALQMKQRLAEVQAELERQTHQATSGGGLVTATVTGRGDLIDIKISPQAVRSGDTEMLEELIKSAVGAAETKAKDAAKQAFARLTGGLSVPGLEGLLGS